MKTLTAILTFLLSLAAVPCGFSANIVWVSDALNVGTNTVGAGPYPDDGIVSLLTGAGHTVTRFNPADATPLTAGEIATLNASNLVIIGRSIGSGAFNPATVVTPLLPVPWNTSITAPMIVTNTYMTRSNRLGWFTGGPNQPDQVLNPLTFPNPASPVSSFIIGPTAMAGATTVNSMTAAVVYTDLAVDIRGISEITDPPVAGATVIATTAVGAATGNYIVSWPAGTAVRGGADILSGYRMQFLVGNRESATAPNTTIGHAGFENLTPEGEGMFLRAVQLAINNGVIPEPTTAAFILLAGSAFLRRRRPV